MHVEPGVVTNNWYARLFKQYIDDPEERIIAIMKNIIKHGSFKPELEMWTVSPDVIARKTIRFYNTRDQWNRQGVNGLERPLID